MALALASTPRARCTTLARMTRRPSAPWAPLLLLNALSDPRFVPVALAGMFGVLALRVGLEPFSDQDAGWIAAAGRRMLATGQVPRVNGWSIHDAATPWVMHEWALGPLYAVLMRTLGLAGPVALGMVAAAVTTILLVTLTVGRARNLGAGALACLLALVLTRECLFQPRPAYVCLGLPLLMAWLALGERISWSRAAACVLLEACWANVHGSFPIGIGVLALGLTRTEDRGRRVVALVASGLATLATPYGISLLALVARYVEGGDATADAIRDHLAELQPLWAASAPFGGPLRIATIVLLVVLALAGLRGSRTERADAVFTLALAGLATLQSRHVPQATTLGLVLVLPVFERVVDRARITAPPHGPAVARRTSLAVAASGSLAIVLACALGIHADAALGADALPSLAHDPRARGRPTYVPFDAAGRFLWLGGDDARVFFDPRNDCYPAETALAAYAIEEGDCTDECVERTLVAAGAEVALVPDGHPAAIALRASHLFVVVRREGDWQLLTRR
jgi:hypothetical protein